MYSKYGKRTIDFLLSLAGIIILSPLLIVLMVLIKVTSPGPVFFKQKRVGIHKSYFNILKLEQCVLIHRKICLRIYWKIQINILRVLVNF